MVLQQRVSCFYCQSVKTQCGTEVKSSSSNPCNCSTVQYSTGACPRLSSFSISKQPDLWVSQRVIITALPKVFPVFRIRIDLPLPGSESGRHEINKNSHFSTLILNLNFPKKYIFVLSCVPVSFRTYKINILITSCVSGRIEVSCRIRNRWLKLKPMRIRNNVFALVLLKTRSMEAENSLYCNVMSLSKGLQGLLETSVGDP
jgi:hypothetical protein